MPGRAEAWANRRGKTGTRMWPVREGRGTKEGLRVGKTVRPGDHENVERLTLSDVHGRSVGAWPRMDVDLGIARERVGHGTGRRSLRQAGRRHVP